MELDIWPLYGSMLRSRLFEEAVAGLWHDGLISGEMHLGTGEEAIIAGVVALLEEDDALALDHRGTAALLMRGIPPHALLRTINGKPPNLLDPIAGCAFAPRCPRAGEWCYTAPPKLVPGKNKQHRVACWHPVGGNKS